ncbi:MAG TPA: sigma-70 family RNA polymerase sigma factor [Vicinamibacterales bacterium]|nr:sigma-70 family RNA polymerase sigma factor [Vicinamibacterales bacterium]
MDNHEQAVRLVRAAQRGNRSAFGKLYQRYTGLVHSIALSSLPIDEITDTVQETFLRALRRLKTLKKPDAFGAWISTITRNVVRDVQRQRWALAPQNEEDALQQATQEHELDANAARHAIQSLPKAYRETVAMRVIDGMSGPEIADRTGLSAGSVRVNLHRGMKLLRERLECLSGGRTPRPRRSA